jgi:hypothetical protein
LLKMPRKPSKTRKTKKSMKIVVLIGENDMIVPVCKMLYTVWIYRWM